MQPRYKGFNKYQPTCKDELEKTISLMEGTLNALQHKREPELGLLVNLMSRVAKYKSLLPKKGTKDKPSLLFPKTT